MQLALAEALARSGVRDARVLAAMMRLPRAPFLPPELRQRAEEDEPLPVGSNRTTPRPSIVASIASALGVRPPARLLTIGSGHGYLSALLHELGGDVFHLESVPALAEQSALAFASLGLRIRLRCDDGADGWPDEAPFDGIVLGALTSEVPPKLVRQLAPNGRLVTFLGPTEEDGLLVVTRAGDDLRLERLGSPAVV